MFSPGLKGCERYGGILDVYIKAGDGIGVHRTKPSPWVKSGIFVQVDQCSAKNK